MGVILRLCPKRKDLLRRRKLGAKLGTCDTQLGAEDGVLPLEREIAPQRALTNGGPAVFQEGPLSSRPIKAAHRMLATHLKHSRQRRGTKRPPRTQGK